MFVPAATACSKVVVLALLLLEVACQSGVCAHAWAEPLAGGSATHAVPG